MVLGRRYAVGLDADIAAIQELANTDGNFIVGDGSTWKAESGTTARTSLGLGTGDSPTFAAITTTGTGTFDTLDLTTTTTYDGITTHNAEFTIQNLKDTAASGFSFAANTGDIAFFAIYADGNAGSWAPYLYWEADVAGRVSMRSDVAIDFMPSNDNTDYIRFQTVSNVPEITTLGACDLKITASSGVINFDDEDLTTSGRIISTGGGQTGKFLTGNAGNTVFSFSGDNFDIRAGSGSASSQNVMRVDNSGHFDFYDGNLTTSGTLGAGATTLTGDLSMATYDIECNEIKLLTGDYIGWWSGGARKSRIYTSDNSLDLHLTSDDAMFLVAGGTVSLTTEGTIRLRPSSNTEYYLQLQTIDNIPEITTYGTCELKLSNSLGPARSVTVSEMEDAHDYSQVGHLPLAGGTLTGAVLIDGSADVVQLTVKGHSTLTANLQNWTDNADTILASVDAEGNIYTGGSFQADVGLTLGDGTAATRAITFDIDGNDGIFSYNHTDEKFEINGKRLDIGVGVFEGQGFYGNNDPDTYIAFIANQFEFTAGGYDMLKFVGTGKSISGIFNFSAADIDFIVQGDTDTQLLYCNAGTDRIGVSTDAPTGKVEIEVDDAAAIPCLTLDQNDISEGTINFEASDRGVIAGATNSVESIRVEVNGVVRRIAIYADA